MDDKFIANQIQEIETGLKNKSLDMEDRRIWTILEYLNTLLKSDNDSIQKKEDLRRLALEMNFNETKGFGEWMKNNTI